MTTEAFVPRENVDVENTAIAELVAAYPRLEPVLNTFGLDTCCGGAYSPLEAAQKHGIDPAPLVEALHEALSDD